MWKKTRGFVLFLIFVLQILFTHLPDCVGRARQIIHSNYAKAEGLININIANLEELDSLPGIGASKAQAIIDYRTDNGDFVIIEDIKNVAGIGETTFENIKDLIIVGEISEQDLDPEPEPEPDPEPEIEIELININNATLEELDTLPGIGATYAQRIIDYRTDNNDFQAIEDIKNVTGIGDTIFDNIKDLITVGETSEPDSPSAEASEDKLDTEPEEQTPTSTPEEIIGEGTSLKKEETYGYGDVVINEFCSDPDDEGVEFVEIYNLSGESINLDGWYLYDGSEGKTTLTGSLDKFYTIENPKGNLNNAGDIIILKFNTTIIDQVAYGDWDDFNISNNAPVASDPYSVARKIDGYSTSNNQNDFVVTTTVPMGESNIITKVDAFTEEEYALSLEYDYSDDIVISEIFPNPEGKDNEDEFIELFNKGERGVDLTGWQLSDSTSRKFIVETQNVETQNFASVQIKPQDYFVIYRKESGIALNNTTDTVELYQPLKDKPMQVVKYENSVEGWSYAQTQIATNMAQMTTDSDWEWTEIVTPGDANIIESINHAPVVDFSFPDEILVKQEFFFDSSDTFDEDGDELEFFWDFGDGFTSKEASPSHFYLITKMYQVKLKVSDGENETEIEKMINVLSTEAQSFEIEPNSNNFHIIISEFLPNPAGVDTDAEWIEVQNIGTTTANLFNWQLDDEEGGSKPYIISEDIFINPLEFKIFDRTETGIALNNTTDSVRLFNATGKLVDEYIYDKPKNGVSFVKQNGSWVLAGATTPGKENKIIQTGLKSTSLSKTSTSKTSTKKTNSKYKSTVETTLEKIREFEKGDVVKVAGTVAVLPGVFSTQYFYIVGSPGVQVYSSKKLFPDLSVGDQVTVSGELSESYGELRLKTSSAEDIIKIATSTPPEPTITECDKISENMEGRLVRIKGEVTEKKGSTIWLDDGNSEIEVYIKTGAKVNKNKIKEGENITAIGIVSQKNDSYRIMPRCNEDIIIENNYGEGEVLGAVSINDEWLIAKNNKKSRLMKYLLVMAGGLIVVLGGVVWREGKTRN